MSNNHSHNKHDHCEHKEVKFCNRCNVIHCLECKREWSDCKLDHHYNWPPFYTINDPLPRITYGYTLNGNATNLTLDSTNPISATVCSHN